MNRENIDEVAGYVAAVVLLIIELSVVSWIVYLINGEITAGTLALVLACSLKISAYRKKNT